MQGIKHDLIKNYIHENAFMFVLSLMVQSIWIPGFGELLGTTIFTGAATATLAGVGAFTVAAKIRTETWTSTSNSEIWMRKNYLQL